jgi:hypothetical protein
MLVPLDGHDSLSKSEFRLLPAGFKQVFGATWHGHEQDWDIQNLKGEINL